MFQKIQIVIFTLVFTFILFTKLNAQGNVIIRYFDNHWWPTTKEKAVFYTRFVKMDSFYQCTSYWVGSDKLNCKSTYADTNLVRAIGKLIRYYENGVVADSMLFMNGGKIEQHYHFQDNGKPVFHHFYDTVSDSMLGENYDSAGNKIQGLFTFYVQAKFPGGQQAWERYIAKHLDKRVPVKNNAPPGLYKVNVTFIVEEDGKILKVYAGNNPGYGTVEEALRVIKNSPSWIPAEHNGKKEVYLAGQDITFTVGKS